MVGLGAGSYLFIQGFRLLQRRKLVLDTPVSKIRSASMGMVELSGQAVGPYTVIAPVTARPCYYYRTVVWEWRQQGKNRQWVQVAAECMHVPFFLDDNTGRVMVDPRGADLDLHRDFQQEFCDGLLTMKEQAPPNVRNFLFQHGISTQNKIKVEEYCIKPKNSLFLLGTLDENPGLEVTAKPIRDTGAETYGSGNGLSFSLGGAAFSFTGSGSGAASLFSSLSSEREEAFVSSVMIPPVPMPSSSSTGARSQVIRLSPDPAPANTAEMTQQQKVAAALIKAGISNPAAWAAAGVTPSSSVVVTGEAKGMPDDGAPDAPQTATGQDGFDPRPPVVLMKGRNNPTFLISWRSQRELAKSLGWKCSLMIWGGPALALLSLYVLLQIVHFL